MNYLTIEEINNLKTGESIRGEKTKYTCPYCNGEVERILKPGAVGWCQACDDFHIVPKEDI